MQIENDQRLVTLHDHPALVEREVHGSLGLEPHRDTPRPKNGRRRRFPKPEQDLVICEDESLRIVPAPLWDRVKKRQEEVRQNWPGEVGRRGFEVRRKARVAIYPAQLFSGGMTCAECGNSILQVSGKPAATTAA